MTGSLDRLGLPSAEQLRDYEIWDAYLTPAFSHPGADGLSGFAAEMKRSRSAIQKADPVPEAGGSWTTEAELRLDCSKR